MKYVIRSFYVFIVLFLIGYFTYYNSSHYSDEITVYGQILEKSSFENNQYIIQFKFKNHTHITNNLAWFNAYEINEHIEIVYRNIYIWKEGKKEIIGYKIIKLSKIHDS